MVLWAVGVGGRWKWRGRIVGRAQHRHPGIQDNHCRCPGWRMLSWRILRQCRKTPIRSRLLQAGRFTSTTGCRQGTAMYLPNPVERTLRRTSSPTCPLPKCSDWGCSEGNTSATARRSSRQSGSSAPDSAQPGRIEDRTSSGFTHRSRSRSGERGAGYTRTTHAAGSSGMHATTWVDEWRTTGARSCGGSACTATLHKLSMRANRETGPAIADNVRRSCTGPTIHEGCKACLLENRILAAAVGGHDKPTAGRLTMSQTESPDGETCLVRSAAGWRRKSESAMRRQGHPVDGQPDELRICTTQTILAAASSFDTYHALVLETGRPSWISTRSPSLNCSSV